MTKIRIQSLTGIGIRKDQNREPRQEGLEIENETKIVIAHMVKVRIKIMTGIGIRKDQNREPRQEGLEIENGSKIVIVTKQIPKLEPKLDQNRNKKKSELRARPASKAGSELEPI
ncbi:hypothetical protein EVAR_74470_1 [Eumeta japonica]|uniref:Uncharacterized protein n=1 Tax=Eumeta variegata TaxID=151549 RepID=A0A4C1TCC2_EUMVA|nr:hypothetical protein EVAR_74470_1 [Eumeta japonica]